MRPNPHKTAHLFTSTKEYPSNKSSFFVELVMILTATSIREIYVAATKQN